MIFCGGNDCLCGLYETRDFNKVANWIIKNNNLTKDQALAVWQGYCNKRVVGGDKKVSGRERIVKEYDKRIVQEKKRLQADIQAQKEADEKLRRENAVRDASLKVHAEQIPLLKKKNEIDSMTLNPRAQVRLTTQKEILQQRMKHHGLDPEQCVYLPQDFEMLQHEYEYCGQLCNDMLQSDPSDVWTCRAQAANKTIDNDCSQSWHEVHLSPQVQGYLAAQGLSADLYKTCYGTALQQQLHVEVCTLFASIAQAQLSSSYGQAVGSRFLNMATQCGDAGYWSNQFEVPSLAMGLVDLGSACCTMGAWVIQNGPIYLQAMRDGVAESVWDFVHMVSHPREVIEGIGKAAWFVFDTITVADEDAMGGMLSITQKHRQERFDVIHAAVLSAESAVANSTGPQRAKMVTKFAIDCLFQHKALQVVGACAGIVRVNAGTMRTMESVADLISHESEFALAAESIAQATQELDVVVQKSLQSELVQLSEAMPVQSLGEVVEQSVKAM